MRYNYLLTVLMLCLNASLFAQDKGRVHKDGTNKPLAGVNIYLHLDKGITITNSEGEYILPESFVKSENDTIYFSYVGYTTKGITWKELKKNEFLIILTEKAQMLEAITVMGEESSLKQFLDYEVLAPMPEGAFTFAASLTDGKIYVAGGNVSTLTHVSWEQYGDRCYVYDIATNSWEETPHKLGKRACHIANYHDGRLYILGGKRLSTNKKVEYLDERIEICDLQQGTIQTDKHTNPHQTVNPASFIYNGNLIVMGGSVAERKSGSRIYSNKAHIFDLKTGYWYELPEMAIGKEPTGIIVGNTIYLMGGYKDVSLRDIEAYDLVKGIWSKSGELMRVAGCPAVACDGSIIYVFENGVMQTYDIQTKKVKAYRIDLPLEFCKMFYANNKLYILGGKTKVDFGGMGKGTSNGVFCVSLDEFEKTTSFLDE